MQFIKPGTTIDFVSRRFLFLSLSAAVIAIGLISLIFHGGLNYGIDFVGGTLVQVKFGQATTPDAIRDALQGLDLGNSTIQQFEEAEGGEFLIRVEKSKADLVDLSDEIKGALDIRYGPGQVDIRRVEMVGPKVGEDLRRKGIFAIIYAIIGILVYVTFRFEFKFAVGAVVALVHDVLITVGLFSLLNMEFSLPIVAALLAIVGYSLNDTIVVYDRIRENLRKAGRKTYEDVINASINETLSRTILTSLTTLLVLISLYFLGGGVIHDFAFALIVGVVVGTYSSIFIASPVVIAMRKMKFLQRQNQKV
ncbi:MAG: protein translocase subunit SecF [Deltaproteobacteria bacterium]|nr:protein translocase subunit SecF [Candidatus Anaeroferrophillus wilburensis]MBN2889862.1 protein translocase subunit SecF [Deltaproteobacteria bacterium]